jgi:hypothetical protein
MFKPLQIQKNSPHVPFDMNRFRGRSVVDRIRTLLGPPGSGSVICTDPDLVPDPDPKE